MIVVIDNQSVFIKEAFSLMERLGVPYRRVQTGGRVNFSSLRPHARGLILSGGPGNPETRRDLAANYAALEFLDVPTIGFCLGHEIINHYFGGSLEDCEERQDKMEDVTILDAADPLLAGLPDTVKLQERHHWRVKNVGTGLRVLGKSSVCPVEIFRHVDRPIYGFQSHPEASGEHGRRIMMNFLRLCGYEN